MEWERRRISRWICGNYTITEDATAFGRFFVLDAPDHRPQTFATLHEAKNQAELLNELAECKEEIERLRNERTEIGDDGDRPHLKFS